MIPKEEEEVKRAEQAAAELQSSVTSVQKLRLVELRIDKGHLKSMSYSLVRASRPLAARD